MPSASSLLSSASSLLNSALRSAEQHPGRTLSLVGLTFVITYLVAIHLLRKPDDRVVVGDAVHYYVYIRSVVFDRDLHFRNDYIRLYGLRGGEPDTEWVYTPTATGHTRNMMSVGPPLVWAPLFLLVTVGASTLGALGLGVPPDGFGRVFQASAGVSGIVAATIGAWFTYRLCERFFTRAVAFWCTLTTWLATSALYYSLVSPTYSHAASMLASGVFFYGWGTTIGDRGLWRYARVGAFAGIAALIRWQDAVFLAAPAVEALWAAFHDRAPLSRRIGHLLQRAGVLTVAAGVAFLPQNLVWLILYGHPFTIPQGEAFMQWFRPHLLDVLFSDWHGLITWTPIVAISIAGLFWLRRVSVPLMLGAVAVLLVSYYANAAVLDWWAGEAFGSRRFVSCFPVFALGLSAAAARWTRQRAALVVVAIALSALNLLLLFQYQLYMHGWRDIAPYPGGLYGMTVERFVVPVRAVVKWCCAHP